jgi:ElaB/YqjD/DUF883 family membrane-anchored ribosome-binding protein
MTTVLKRGVYVAVGAADLAAEKMRDIPVVQQVRGRSLLDAARDIEPKLRKRADELSKRGEQSVERLRTRVDQARTQVKQLPDEAAKQIKEFPTEARKQVVEFRTDARKQVRELRTRLEKALSTNGSTAAKPAARKPTGSQTKAS